MQVGFVTIGQSPRVDVVPEIMPFLGNVEVVECGALDELTDKEIEKLYPQSGGYVLVSRLRNGKSVKMQREKIMLKVQKCIDDLSKTVDVVALLCTGEFPELRAEKILIEPSVLLTRVVDALSPSKLGILVPEEEQIPFTMRKWRGISLDVVVRAFSPYVGEKDELKRVAGDMIDRELIVMDCIGYNLQAKEIVKRITAKPVILPRTLTARLIGELLR